eukprot:GEMP01108187.1.p1 GENE.GEMP01108187.1~~GEMP01108187.1.p1  ORF type:complete len:151 (+),score=36.78 GEMP01108187.1:190-642(+)
MVPITQIQGVPIADRVEVTAGSLPARYFGRDVHEGGLLSCAEAAALTSLGLLAVSSHADEGASPRQQSTTLAGHERLTAIMARFLEEGYVVRSGLKFGVKVLPEEAPSRDEVWRDLAGSVRLCHQVAKALLLVAPNGDAQVIKRFQLHRS